MFTATQTRAEMHQTISSDLSVQDRHKKLMTTGGLFPTSQMPFPSRNWRCQHTDSFIITFKENATLWRSKLISHPVRTSRLPPSGRS